MKTTVEENSGVRAQGRRQYGGRRQEQEARGMKQEARGRRQGQGGGRRHEARGTRHEGRGTRDEAGRRSRRKDARMKTERGQRGLQTIGQGSQPSCDINLI
jgi:hypothetical protein